MLSICAAVGQVGPSAAWGVVGSVELASRKRRGSDRSRCFMIILDIGDKGNTIFTNAGGNYGRALAFDISENTNITNAG